MKRFVALLAGLCGCATHVSWIGGDLARRVHAEVRVHGGQQRFFVDGVEGPPAEEIAIDGIVFSRDGRHFAYPARHDGRWSMHVDHRAGALWDGVAEPAFTDDGARFVYLAEQDGKWRVVSNETAGAVVEAFASGSLRLSPDGKHHVAIAADGTCVSLVVDETKSACFQGIRGAVVTNDGSVFAVLRRDGRQSFLARTTEEPPVDEISEWVVAPDGSRRGYLAREGASWRPVMDGESKPTVIAARSLRIGNSGRTFAWVETVEGGARVAVDGKRLAPWAAIGLLVVAEGSPATAFVAEDEHGAWLVVDGAPRGPFSGVDDLALSADGTHVAAVVRRSAGWAVLHDADEFRFNSVVSGSLALSPDGRHWAAIVGDDATRTLRITIDGERDLVAPAEEVFGELNRPLRAWVAARLSDALPSDVRERPAGE